MAFNSSPCIRRFSSVATRCLATCKILLSVFSASPSAGVPVQQPQRRSQSSDLVCCPAANTVICVAMHEVFAHGDVGPPSAVAAEAGRVPASAGSAGPSGSGVPCQKMRPDICLTSWRSLSRRPSLVLVGGCSLKQGQNQHLQEPHRGPCVSLLCLLSLSPFVSVSLFRITWLK